MLLIDRAGMVLSSLQSKNHCSVPPYLQEKFPFLSALYYTIYGLSIGFYKKILSSKKRLLYQQSFSFSVFGGVFVCDSFSDAIYSAYSASVILGTLFFFDALLIQKPPIGICKSMPKNPLFYS